MKDITQIGKAEKLMVYSRVKNLRPYPDKEKAYQMGYEDAIKDILQILEEARISL